MSEAQTLSLTNVPKLKFLIKKKKKKKSQPLVTSGKMFILDTKESDDS